MLTSCLLESAASISHGSTSLGVFSPHYYRNVRSPTQLLLRCHRVLFCNAGPDRYHDPQTVEIRERDSGLRLYFIGCLSIVRTRCPWRLPGESTRLDRRPQVACLAGRSSGLYVIAAPDEDPQHTAIHPNAFKCSCVDREGCCHNGS